MNEVKPEVRIEDWTKDTHTYGSYLSGYVFDHPRFTDGTFIRTSRIIDDHPNGVIETGETLYRLGTAQADRA